VYDADFFIWIVLNDFGFGTQIGEIVEIFNLNFENKKSPTLLLDF
jgi:hypothetical protein